MKKVGIFAFIAAFSYLYITAARLSGANAAPEEVDPSSSTSVNAPADSTTGALPDSLDNVGTDLEDFTIVTTKKLVVSDGAKLTYNVTEDPESKSSNILDILRKVPGVTVDAEENVRVNGQSNFKIFMNGHEDAMFQGADLKTVLKSLPAASIKKIEVISEPGAKYEAEGIGGILNIVTDTNSSLAGFVTNLSGWINASNTGGYADFKTKIDKVMLGATVNYNNGFLLQRSFSSYGYTETLSSSDPEKVENTRIQRSRGKGGWDYTGVRANMSWEPDTLNLFTISANYGYNTWNTRRDETRSFYTGALDGDEDSRTPLWRIRRHFDMPGFYTGVSAQTSYQHNFGRTDNNLVVSYLYNFSFDKSKTNVFLEQLEGTLSENPFSGTRNTSHVNSHVFQIDYSNQFNAKHLLETGAKANLNNSRSDEWSLLGNDRNDALIDDDSKVNVTQFNDIYALYASYTGSFSPVTVKGGVRYEHTRIGLKYHVGDFDSYTTRLNDIVPNAAVSYNFTPSSTLRLAYQMRISRPSLSYLSPYRNTTTPGYVQYGNPDLKSQKSHNVSIAYSNYGGDLSGSAKLTYRHIDNGIADILFTRDGVINSTYANVGKDRTVQLDLNGDWNITPSLRWSVYFSTNYEHIKAESEMIKASKHGWQCNVYSNVNYTLPCNLRLSGYGGYWTGWIDLQSKGSDGYYYGLSASRSFLKEDALTLQLGLSSLLPVCRDNRYTQTSETVRTTNNFRFKQWNVSFGISWRFGGLKANIKQTNADVEAEVSSDGGQGGGQGRK